MAALAGWLKMCTHRDSRQMLPLTMFFLFPPQWSLGAYSHTAKTVAASGAVEQATDVFSGGQHCDETGVGRSTRVEFRCCSEDDGAGAAAAVAEAVASAGDKSRNKRRPKAPALATLSAIREPEVCAYEAVVCTPLLCGAPAAGRAGAGGRRGGKNASALALLEPLSGVCLSRHEGWWSYELCYRRHARQFHLEAGTDAKGKATSRVASEFVLGRAPADLDAALDAGTAQERDYLVPPRPDAEDAANAPSSLEVTGDGLFVRCPPGSLRVVGFGRWPPRCVRAHPTPLTLAPHWPPPPRALRSSTSWGHRATWWPRRARPRSSSSAGPRTRSSPWPRTAPAITAWW